MSRSRKKKPIAKDKTNHKWYNRIFRRVNKQRINSDKEPKLMNEAVNQYNVSDWRFDATNTEFEETIKRK